MKYDVKVYDVYSYIITVDAENDNDARSKANKLFWHGNYPDGSSFPNAEYDYTMNNDDWTVFSYKV